MTHAKSHSGVGRFAREQPLLTAVLCVSFGVALGCMLRMTPEDGEFLAEQADKLKDQASKLRDTVGEYASAGYERARQYADRAMDTASDAMHPVKTSWGKADDPSQQEMAKPVMATEN